MFLFVRYFVEGGSWKHLIKKALYAILKMMSVFFLQNNLAAHENVYIENGTCEICKQQQRVSSLINSEKKEV